MSNIRTTIHADKAGILEHLEEKRKSHAKRASESYARVSSQRDRRHQDGIALGLQLAITAIENWAEADGFRDAIKLLDEFRDGLPTGHQEKPGIIRAIEVLTHYAHQTT